MAKKYKVTLRPIGRAGESPRASKDAPLPGRAVPPIGGRSEQSPRASKTAPAAPRTAQPAYDLSTPGGQGHALAETVVMGFIDRLRQEARMWGGKLTLADLERLTDDFHDKSAALRQAFEMSFEAYARAREHAKASQNRHYPFNRLLVQRFEHLLVRGKGRDGIPRRVLPGFFMAVEMMLGPQVYEAYQEHGRAIVARLHEAKGSRFGWADLYADPEAATLAFDALAVMESYFADYDKRARWFLTVVNGHLGPAHANATPEEAAWQLDEAAFKDFLAALFAELRDSVGTAVARTDFIERFGVEKCRAVTDAVARIYGR
ncbi:MAG: hypothetical protein FJW24_00785 [Acidimicrobiia bacterium]|nr:hypothetical protein [Acidimicrobiia bacterium]